MRRLLMVTATAILSFLAFDSASAQGPAEQEDSVTVLQGGIDRLKTDLKAVVDLAPKGAKQWKNLEDFLDATLGPGIESKKPVRVDVILGDDTDYRFWIPVSNLPAFLGNVRGFVGQREKRLATGYYEWKGPGWTGSQRDIKDYAAMAALKPNLPAGLPAPDFSELTDGKYDLAGILTNSAAGQEARRKAIQDVRQELADKIKKLPDEEEHDFELRKLVHEQQLDELERFYVESEHVVLGWTLDESKKPLEARLDVKLTALPGTTLQASIDELAAEPSQFAGVERTKHSTLFGRINHPLDKMRKDNAKEFMELVKKQAEERIPASKKISEGHKDSYKTAVTLFIDMILDGIEMGILDGFIHIEKPDDMHVMVGAIRVPDGEKLVPVLEALKGAEWDVQLDTEKVGDLALHVVHVPQRDEADFSHLFGKEATLVIGTSKDAVWYSAGADAANRLKAAVEKSASAEKQNDGVFVEIWSNLGPWMQYLLERRARVQVDQTKLTEADKKARKTKEELLKTAIEAFKPGNATIHMKLQRVEKEVVGTTILSEDTLRFGGIKMADFAEEKLQ